MNGWVKFIIGAVVTSLMAMAAHSWLGIGNAFVNNLEEQGRTALGEAGGNGVTLSMEREPSLHRVAILSGPADAATRERLLAAVRAVPGMADARWADEPVAAAPATAEAVAACQTQVDAAIEGKTIQFDNNSAAIKPESQPLIAALAAALGPCNGTVVEVAGHTDATGSPATNAQLSQARADAVMGALTSAGVPAERLIAHGYGSSQPKVQGTSAAANAANRRIEFKVSSSAGAPAPAAPTAPASGGN